MKNYLFLLFLIISFSGFSQSPVDSLKQVVEKTAVDSVVAAMTLPSSIDVVSAK